VIGYFKKLICQIYLINKEYPLSEPTHFLRMRDLGSQDRVLYTRRDFLRIPRPSSKSGQSSYQNNEGHNAFVNLCVAHQEVGVPNSKENTLKNGIICKNAEITIKFNRNNSYE
jgi:hypothetical protein